MTITKEYRVKGIFSTGKFYIDSWFFTTWEDMEEVTGKKMDQAAYITVKVKPGATRIRRSRMNFSSMG